MGTGLGLPLKTMRQWDRIHIYQTMFSGTEEWQSEIRISETGTTDAPGAI